VEEGVERREELEEVEKPEEGVERPRRCPECGSELLEGFRYCPRCGWRITEMREKPEEAAERREEVVKRVEGVKPSLDEVEAAAPWWVRKWCEAHEIDLGELVELAEELRGRSAARVYEALAEILRRGGTKPKYAELTEGIRAVQRVAEILEELRRSREAAVKAEELKESRPREREEAPEEVGEEEFEMEELEEAPTEEEAKPGKIEPLTEEMIGERGKVKHMKNTILLVGSARGYIPSGLYCKLCEGEAIPIELHWTVLSSIIFAQETVAVAIASPTDRSRMALLGTSVPTRLESQRSRVYLEKLSKRLRYVDMIITTRHVYDAFLSKWPELRGWRVVDVDVPLKRELAKRQLMEVAGLSERDAKLLARLQSICPDFAYKVRELREKVGDRPAAELAEKAVKEIYSAKIRGHPLLSEDDVNLLAEAVRHVLEEGEALLRGYEAPEWLEDLELIKRVEL